MIYSPKPIMALIKKHAQQFRIHDIDKLLDFARLRTDLDHKRLVNRDFNNYWLHLMNEPSLQKPWSEKMRYELPDAIDRISAQQFIIAVKEITQWINGKL